MYYLDTSAAVKLLIVEKGSTALRRWLESHEEEIFSSDLLRTELLRVTRRAAPELMVQARIILDTLIMVTLSTTVFERAVMIEPGILRSLDALHLAAALELGDDLQGLITYDQRLADSAKTLGIDVVTP